MFYLKLEIRKYQSTYDDNFEAVFIRQKFLAFLLIQQLLEVSLVGGGHLAAGPVLPLLGEVEIPAVRGALVRDEVLQLPHAVRDHLVQGEGREGVDAEHLPQGILERHSVHVAVQDRADHVEEGGVVVGTGQAVWKKTRINNSVMCSTLL